MAQKYKLSEKALLAVKGAIKDYEVKASLISYLRRGERQIQNILSDNGVNGILTTLGMVTWVKDNTSLTTESQILKEVK